MIKCYTFRFSNEAVKPLTLPTIVLFRWKIDHNGKCIFWLRLNFQSSFLKKCMVKKRLTRLRLF